MWEKFEILGIAVTVKIPERIEIFGIVTLTCVRVLENPESGWPMAAVVAKRRTPVERDGWSKALDASRPIHLLFYFVSINPFSDVCHELIDGRVCVLKCSGLISLISLAYLQGLSKWRQGVGVQPSATKRNGWLEKSCLLTPPTPSIGSGLVWSHQKITGTKQKLSKKHQRLTR